MNKPIPKFYPEKSDDNIVVEVTLIATEESLSLKDFVFKCVGVLVKENDDEIRLALKAVNDAVIEYQDIKIKDILDIKVIDSDEIEIIS